MGYGTLISVRIENKSFLEHELDSALTFFSAYAGIYGKGEGR